MNWIVDLLPSVGVPGDVIGWVVVLVDVAIKSVLVLGVTAAVAFGLRGASAALRHQVWAVALGGLLMLPVLSIVLPHWQLAFLPAFDTVSPVPPVVPNSEPAGTRALVPGTAIQFEPARESSTAEVVPEPPPSPEVEFFERSGTRLAVPAPEPPNVLRSGLPDWPVMVLSAWLIGAALVVALLALGFLRVWMIAKTAKPIRDGELLRLAEAAAEELGITRPVRLLESQTGITPMTWGYRQPVVLFPREAAAWPFMRRRDVLLHELAHVRRNDFMLQLIARYTCAVYWFNPLVWLAARQLRLERERACDDTVLNAGARPSEYANHLLEIARSLKASQSTAFATVAMARPSQLTGRLLDVLDDTRNRRAVSGPTSAIAWLIGVALLVPLACAHPVQSAQATPAPLAPEPAMVSSAQPRSTVPEPLSVAEPVSVSGRFDPADYARLQPVVVLVGSRAALFHVQDTQCDVRRGDKHGTSSNSNDDRHTIRWWEGNCEGLIRIRGEVGFNEDFTDVVRVSRSGLFSIEIDYGEIIREVSITNDRGSTERRWFVNRDEQTYDSDAVAWFASALQDFFRRSSYKLDERVEYILETRGVDGLLQEASLASSTYLRARYYEKAIQTGQLTTAQVAAVLERAQQEIESDYELSRLLRSVPARYLQDPNLRRSYVQASNSLDSDYERGRVLRAILTQEGLGDDLVMSLLQSARGLDSDYELARLLMEIAGRYLHNDRLRAAYLATADDIGSDYERSRVLRAVFEQPNLTNEILLQLLESAVEIDSDYELSRVLRNTAGRYVIDATLRATFFQAVNSIESDYEKRRILAELLQQRDLSAAIVQDVLESAMSLDSDHELSTILRGAASRLVLDETLRPIFFRAVGSLSSDYERRRVLQQVTQADDVSRAVLLDAINVIS
ncbi:MAG: M56 family metallopeptidase, partial [Gemmatimonadales bacterium]